MIKFTVPFEHRSAVIKLLVNKLFELDGSIAGTTLLDHWTVNITKWKQQEIFDLAVQVCKICAQAQIAIPIT